jgi:hypothetical protein
MCQFKSGIILKNRVFIANEDHHSNMLQELGIKDDYFNATKVFVRAELVPANDEWWTDPDSWRMIVDQDEVPDWFELDRQKFEAEFRAAVKEWWLAHVLVDQKIEELTNGYYRLMRCEVKKLINDVKIAMCNSSQVGEMYDSSQVGEMCNSSQVGKMWGSSQVGKMWGSSQVGEMYDSSQVGEMYDSSQVGEMCNSSQVGEMWGSAIARHYGKRKIFISPECNLAVTVFENPTKEAEEK